MEDVLEEPKNYTVEIMDMSWPWYGQNGGHSN